MSHLHRKLRIYQQLANGMPCQVQRGDKLYKFCWLAHKRKLERHIALNIFLDYFNHIEKQEAPTSDQFSQLRSQITSGR
eukprot:c41606_g1_i1 orf=60-296(+)